jgi:hypothetical protein
VQSVKSLGWLRFDGATVINRRMAFFESSPWPSFGETSRDESGIVAISSVEHGIPAPKELLEPSLNTAAIYALELALPEARKTRPLPLLCSGVTGNGDLLYFDPLPDGRYRLGVDEWGIGAIFGGAFTPDIGKMVRVEIVVGPALSHDLGLASLPEVTRTAGLQDRIIVWYGGNLVADFMIANHLESFDTLQVALNDAGFSSAVGAFSGELRQLELPKNQQTELLRRAVNVLKNDSQ